MKKFVLHIFLFFCIVGGIDILSGKICNYLRDNNNNSSIQKAVSGEYDCLILGSSKAHHNYVTPIIQDSLLISCYNCGTDGNGVILAYAVYQMACAKHKPAMVIYDVKQQFDMYSYEGDGDYHRYYSLLKPYCDHLEVKVMFDDLDRMESLKLKSNLYRYNNLFLQLLLDYPDRNKKDNLCGYVPSIGQLKEDSEEELDYTLCLDSLKYGYFEKLIAACENNGTELIVSISPEYKSSRNSDFDFLKSYCNNHNVKVIDNYSNPVFSTKISYFKDHCHLNKDGSEAFTDYFVTNFKQIR